jgi:hypothetical protein
VRDWLRSLSPVDVLIALLTAIPPTVTGIYLWIYRANLPISDTLFRSLPIAVAVRTSSLGIEDFFTAYIGQIAVPSYLIAMIGVWIADWNLIAESYVMFGLALVNVTLILTLMGRTEAGALRIAAIPISILVFTLKQRFNWHVSYGSVWMFLNLWLVLGLWLIHIKARHWGIPLVVYLIGILATFTHGQGFIVLFLLLVALALNGYRHWLIYMVGLALQIALIFAYARLAGVTSGGEGNMLSSLDVPATFGFVLPYLGAMFGSVVEVATLAGLVGLGLWLANSIFLWRKYKLWVLLWGLVASFPILTGGLIGLIRTQNLIDPWSQTQYVSGTHLFWVAVVAMMSVTIYRTWAASGAKHWLLWANIICALLGVIGYTASDFLTEPEIDFRYVNEDCHWRLAFVQDVESLVNNEGCVVIERPLEINVLAYYDLAMFADAQRINVLPEQYQLGQKILVVADNGWENYHIARWMLDGVSPEQIYHAFETPPQPFPEYDVELTLDQAFEVGDEALTETLISESRFWTVSYDGLGYELPQAVQVAFIPVAYSYRSPQGLGFDITLHERIEIDEDIQIRFGDQMQMVGYTALSDRVEPCSMVTIRSFWEVTEPPLIDGYSATLTLDQITGDGLWDFETILRSDSQLTLTPTNTWEIGELYVDERTLELPCNLSPGDYVLRLGVYNYRDNIRLTPNAEGQTFHPELNMADVERVTVESPPNTDTR